MNNKLLNVIGIFVAILLGTVALYIPGIIGFHIGKYSIVHSCEHEVEFRVGETKYLCQKVK